MSVLARVFEGAGLLTAAIVTIREHAQKVKPPRALFVPFPFGFTLGRPNDPLLQHRVLEACFNLLTYDSGPALVDFPEEEAPDLLPQSTTVSRPTHALAAKSAADEVTSLRVFYEQWVKDRGTTLVGLSGIPQRRFRGMIRFLEAYAGGENGDLKERPSDIPLEGFIRYCMDDLKAFYYEARMVQSPDGRELDIHEWFWTETAAGQLARQIASRMKETGLGYYAIGIAR